MSRQRQVARRLSESTSIADVARSRSASSAQEPQIARAADELLGPLVTEGVIEVPAATEVLSRPRVVRGDRVPAGPAAGKQVEAGEPPGQVAGLVVGGVLGGDQPDLLGDGGEGGQLRDGIGAAGDIQIQILPFCSRRRRPSPRKKASNSPRSAVMTMRRNVSKSIWEPLEGSDQIVVWLTLWKKTPRCT